MRRIRGGSSTRGGEPRVGASGTPSPGSRGGLGWIGVLLLLALHGSSTAQPALTGRAPALRPGEVEVLAREQHFDDATSTFIFEGDVEARQTGVFKLRADRVVYYQATGWIQAEGAVHLELGKDVLTGAQATYNVKTRRAQIFDVHAVLNPSIIVEAEMIEKLAPHPRTGEDRYFVQRGAFTACHRPGTGWSLRSRSALIHMNNYLHLYGASFRARGVPLFYLPYYVQSIKRERATGFLPPRAGYDSLWGAFVNFEFFWAIAEWIDFTIGLTPYGTSRIDGTARLRFRLSPRDPINVIEAIYQRLIDETRTVLLQGKEVRILQARLAHEFPGRINTTANIQLRNDQLRDDSNLEPRLRASRYSRSEAAAVRSWGSQSLRLLASLTQGLPVPGLVGRERTLTQKLPSLTYSSGAPWNIVGNALQFRIETAAAESLRRREVPLGQTDPNNPKELDLTLWRLHLVPTLQSTITLPGVSIQPSVSLLETYYSLRRTVDPSLGRNSFGTLIAEPNEPEAGTGAFIGRVGDGLFRHLYRVRVELTGPSFYKLYARDEKAGGKLKHLIQPLATYQFSPSVDETEIIDTGELAIDRLGRTSHQITYGLSNSLLHKKRAQASPTEILRFDVTQTFSFLSQEELERLNPFVPGIRKLGDLGFTLQIRPSRNTNATAILGLEPEEWRARRISGSLELRRRLWSLEGNYFRDATLRRLSQDQEAEWTLLRHSVGLGGHVRLGRHWQFRARGSYNILNTFVEDSFLELGYGTQCWGLSLGGGLVERLQGFGPEAPTDVRFSVSFSIHLRNLGSLGTSQSLP
jgi:lipopolysaccharide export system protein LptA